MRYIFKINGSILPNRLLTYVAFLVFSIGVLLPNEGFATHIVGGNLTYKHLFGDAYQVKLVLRRDCLLGSAEAEFDNPASIGIFTSGGALAQWLGNNGQLKLPFMSSDTLNEYIQSDCGFEGTQVCVHETTYIGNVTLPQRPGGYVLAYQRCCRNASLNNVIEPLETGSTYSVVVSEQSLILQNSTPEFVQWPDVYICANKPLIFDHSAMDRDGDSLVYKLCTPSLGATRVNPRPQPPNFPPYNDILWAAPYSLNDMMGGVPLKIDSKTGQVTATPNLVGQFLIGICVEEYRNGQLLSTVRRDFQYNVRICSQPPLAQFSTSESNCDGLTVEFYNESLSSSNYQWDFDFPSTDNTFKSTAKDPVFTFPSSGIYTVRLRATRGTDGCFDTVLQTVAVFENKIIPDFTYALSGCDESNDKLSLLLADLSAFNEPGYTITNREWSVTQNGTTKTYSGNAPIIDLSYMGNVEISLQLSASNGCVSTIAKTINIEDVLPKIDFTYDLNGCTTGTTADVTFNNLSAGLNPFATVATSAWVINGQAYTGDPLLVTLPQNISQVSAQLETSFTGTCKISLTKEFSLTNLLPQADYQFSPVECPDDDNVTISLSYVDTLSLGIASNQLSWLAGTETNKSPFTGTSVDVTIPKDSTLFLDLICLFNNGCTDTIISNFLPGPFATIKFSADPVILCPNQEKTFVVNPNPDWTYTWSPADGLDLTDPSNPKVSVDSNTTYQVTVTDGLCTVVSEVEVLALSGGVILAVEGDTVSCTGDVTLNVTGGIGQGEYAWGTDPNINTQIATGTTITANFAGDEATYYVQFVGEACSTNPAQITVKNQLPRIENISPFTICTSDTTKIITINLVDEHMNTFFWEPNVHVIDGADTSSPTIGVGANETNPFVVYYNVTNQFGCTLRDSIIFTLGQNPTVDFDYDLTECGKYEICFEVNGSFDGFVKWNFGDETTNDDTSIDKQPCYTYPDSGSFDVTIENLVGVCPFLDVNKTIQINPQIRLEPIAPLILCVNDTLNLTATSNLTNIDYTWSDINGNVLVNTANFTTILNGDASFIVEGVDVFGCKDIDTVSATIFRFQFAFDTADSLCVNQESPININIENPEQYTYNWLPAECIVSGGNTNNPIVLATTGKTLSVFLTHIETGCKEEASFVPTITTPFIFDISGPEIFCLAEPTNVIVSIVGPENYDYLWSPAECIVSGINTANPEVSVDQDKTLRVVVTNKITGCIQMQEFNVTAGESVIVDVNAEPDFTIFEGEDLEIFIANPIAGATYEWSTGETGTSIVVSPLEDTDYSVLVTDINGCQAEDIVTVVVRTAKCDETDVYIPNAFTPNNDGNNDVLYVRSNFIDEFEFIIYNRWGEEMFRTNDKSIGWDGSYKGVQMSPDAYAYYLRVLCVNQMEYKKKGNVSLLR